MSVKISELPVLDSLADNDVLAGVDTSANTTSKVTLGSLKEYIDTNTTYTAGTNIDITNNVVSAPNVYNKTETDTLLSAKEDTANKVTSITSSNTNTQYPSAKSVYDHVSGVSNDIMDSVTEATSALQEENEALKEELESVSTIFNAFPTESDEDESMTLDGTADVKFKKFDLKGNTSQFTTTGKNLLPNNGVTLTRNGITFTVNNDGSYTLNGTSTANTDYNICQTGELQLEAGTYTLSSTNNIPSGVWLSVYEGTSDRWAMTGTNTKEMVLSTASNNARVHFYINNGVTLNNLRIYPMIVSGTTVGDYEPYTGKQPSPSPDYPQEVHVVKGDNKIKISGGKNQLGLVDLASTTTSGVTYSISNQVLNINGTSTGKVNMQEVDFNILASGSKTLKIVKESGTFTSGSIGVSFRDSDNTQLNFIEVSYNGTYSTKNIDITKLDHIVIYITNGSAFTNAQIKVMLSDSHTDTYEPYSGNTYNIDLPVENLLQNNLTSGNNNGITYVVNEDKSVTLNGTATAITWLILNTSLTLEAGTYTMTSGYLGNDVRVYSTGLGVYTLDGQRTVTKTSSVTGDVSINIASGTTCNNLTIKPMIEKSTKANSYTPYGITPMKMCKIGNYQDYFTKSDGRNLYKVEDITTTTKNGVTYSVENEIITLNGTVSSGFDINLSSYYPLESGTYTISCQVISGSYTGTIGKYVRKSSGGGYINIIDGGALKNTRTIVVNEDNDNTYSALYLVGGAVCTNLRISIQLEKGSSSSPWQPYEIGKWYKHNVIKKLVLNGSENYQLSKNTTPYVFTRWIEDYMRTAENIMYCNYFKSTANGTYGNMVNGETHFRYYNDNSVALYFCTADYSNATDFKEWISTHNIIVYYVLATPTGEEITYQPLIDQLNAIEKVMSKQGQTNISQVNNDKPFIINAEAILSLQNVLDRVTLLES